jgi:5-methylcytosine-specific restriction endonuclease McrA
MERVMAYQRLLLIPLDPSTQSWARQHIQLEQEKLRKEASTLSPCEITSKIQHLTKLYHNLELEKDGWKPLIHDTLRMYRSLKTKQRIPAAVKRVVWNTYIGEERGNALCVCCKTTSISQMSFHCGHVVSEYHGGTLEVSNLRPICQNCNSSMGKQHMVDFMKKLGRFV